MAEFDILSENDIFSNTISILISAIINQLFTKAIANAVFDFHSQKTHTRLYE